MTPGRLVRFKAGSKMTGSAGRAEIRRHNGVNQGRQEMKVRRFAAGCALALAAGLGPLAPVHAEQTIQFGVVANIAVLWPVFIAEHEGLFKANGLKLEYTTTGQSSKVVQGLAANTFQIGHAGIPDVIRGAEAGGPVKIIGAECAVPPYRWFAQKGITKISELKGKKVMLGGTKDITYVYWQAIVDKANMKMSDFEYLYAGSTTNRFAALVSGGVDATILAQPFDFRAEGMGLPVFAVQKDYTPDSPFTVYATNTAWAAKHRDAVVAYLKSTMAATRWLYDPKNRNEAIDILAKSSKSKPEDAAKTYDLYTGVLKPFREDGAVTDAAMADILKALISFGEIKSPPPPNAKYYDGSFVEAAQKAM